MSTTKDYNKTWIPGNQRGTQTFNAPGTLTIPYGRYKGTVSGRGGSGNAPIASAWTTNYNTNYSVAYPIANQPIATQPVNAYTPGNAGQSTSLLGVTFPGGPVDLSGFAGPPGTATPVGDTAVNYNSYPDNSSYPVTVPTGAQIVVKIE